MFAAPVIPGLQKGAGHAAFRNACLLEVISSRTRVPVWRTFATTFDDAKFGHADCPPESLPPGVMILELCRALGSRARSGVAGVVDLIDKAWKNGGDVFESFVIHQIDGRDLKGLHKALGLGEVREDRIIVVAVGRGHKPPPALGLQVVLAHQAADLLRLTTIPR